MNVTIQSRILLMIILNYKLIHNLIECQLTAFCIASISFASHSSIYNIFSPSQPNYSPAVKAQPSVEIDLFSVEFCKYIYPNDSK